MKSSCYKSAPAEAGSALLMGRRSQPGDFIAGRYPGSGQQFMVSRSGRWPYDILEHEGAKESEAREGAKATRPAAHDGQRTTGSVWRAAYGGQRTTMKSSCYKSAPAEAGLAPFIERHS